MPLPLFPLVFLPLVGQGFGQPAQAGPPEPFRITLPGQGWTLAFDAPPLSNFTGQVTRVGYQLRGAWPGGFTVTVTSEKADKPSARHDESFDHFWPAAQRGPIIDPTTVKVDKTSGRFVKVTYRTKAPTFRPGGFPAGGFGGPSSTAATGSGQAGQGSRTQPPSNPHVNYYFAVNGRWVDVHVSRSPSASDDQEQLARFERTLVYREGTGGR